MSRFCPQAAGIIPTGKRQEASVRSPQPRQAQTDCPWWWQGQWHHHHHATPLQHTKHKQRYSPTSVCCLTTCRGSVHGVGRGRGGGEVSILTHWWTNLSFSLLVLPQSLYTFLPVGSRKLWGRLVGPAGMQVWDLNILDGGESGTIASSRGLLIGLFSF